MRCVEWYPQILPAGPASGGCLKVNALPVPRLVPARLDLAKTHGRFQKHFAAGRPPRSEVPGRRGVPWAIIGCKGNRGEARGRTRPHGAGRVHRILGPNTLINSVVALRSKEHASGLLCGSWALLFSMHQSCTCTAIYRLTSRRQTCKLAPGPDTAHVQGTVYQKR